MGKLGTMLVALVFAGTMALAAEVKYPESDPAISINFPADWKVLEEGVLHAQSADESIGFVAITVAATDFAEAVKELMSELEKIVSDYQEKTPLNSEALELNGFKMLVTDGKGKIDGEEVNIGIVMLTVEGSGKATLIITYGTDESEKKHEAAIKGIVSSLKPAK